MNDKILNVRQTYFDRSRALTSSFQEALFYKLDRNAMRARVHVNLSSSEQFSSIGC